MPVDPAMTADQAAASLADMLAPKQPAGVKPPRRVTGPGIYPDFTPVEYHADPAPEPSLSASVAIALVTQTPFHAWAKHPRLVPPEWRENLGLDEQDTDAKKTLGSVAHEILIGRGQGIHIIQAKGTDGRPAKNYLTKAAKEERDAVLEQGAIPCLERELEKAEEIVDCIRAGLKQIPGCERAFVEGSGEVPAVWHEPGLDVWGRILVDWWSPTGAEIWDLKTTSVGLSDEALRRKIANDQLDLRCAWYERGATRLRPDLSGRVRVNLVFTEAKPPYELRVVRLDNASRAVGHKKVAYALRLWSDCVARDQWPGYPREISRLGLPAFADKQWLEREESEEGVALAITTDPFVSVLDVQPVKALEFLP